MQYLDEKRLLCDLCRQFYNKGWVSGTGGGISFKVDQDLALIAPSGVQKEQIKPEELFLLELKEKPQIIFQPNNLQISACTNIFIKIYLNRPSVGAIIHSHSINAVLLSKINPAETVSFAKYEMLKGLDGGKYSETHTIPILDNVEYECDLAEAVGQTVLDYPKAHAVLVRDHGVYILGKNVNQAKIHAECYDYLFEAQIKEKSLQALGLTPNHQ